MLPFTSIHPWALSRVSQIQFGLFSSPLSHLTLLRKPIRGSPPFEQEISWHEHGVRLSEMAFQPDYQAGEAPKTK